MSGKRELPILVKCLRVNVTMEPAVHAYLMRRAQDAARERKPNASVSGQIGVMAREAQALRHDVPGARHAMLLIAQLLRRHAVTFEEAADLLEQSNESLAAKVAEAQAGAGGPQPR